MCSSTGSNMRASPLTQKANVAAGDLGARDISYASYAEDDPLKADQTSLVGPPQSSSRVQQVYVGKGIEW